MQLLYLTYAEQHVERYGISYFSIENFKGTKLLLGIDSSGINVYRPSDKYDSSVLPICPQPGFSLVVTSWSAPEYYPHMRRILNPVLYIRRAAHTVNSTGCTRKRKQLYSTVHFSTLHTNNRTIVQ